MAIRNFQFLMAIARKPGAMAERSDQEIMDEVAEAIFPYFHRYNRIADDLHHVSAEQVNKIIATSNHAVDLIEKLEADIRESPYANLIQEGITIRRPNLVLIQHGMKKLADAVSECANTLEPGPMIIIIVDDDGYKVEWH